MFLTFASAAAALLGQAPPSSPNGDQCGVTVDSGVARAATYYASIEGFARVARTNGGLGRRFIEVTNNRDDQLPGSLRWAVDEATRQGGGWIGFDPRLSGSTIATYRPLRLPSNVTLDGGCTHVKLVGHGNGSTLYVKGVENVVVSRIQIEMTPRPKESGDCISVTHGSDRVWVAFNRIRACGDGLVDVARAGGGPMRVTISHSRFSDHDAAILIDDGKVATHCGGEPDTMVTLFRNRFVNTGQRHPRVAGNALVHAAQNSIDYVPQFDGGRRGGSYGIFATNGARVLAEDILFAPRQQRLHSVDNAIRSPEQCGPATIEVRRSKRLGGAAPQSIGPHRAMDFPYTLPALPVPVVALSNWLDRTLP